MMDNNQLLTFEADKNLPKCNLHAKKLKMQVPICVTENDSTNLDWDDLVFRFKPDNSFRVYFIKTSEGEVEKKIELGTNIQAALDKNGKICYISFLDPNELGCHLFDYPDTIDGKPPMSLHCKYYRREDNLVIKFIEQSGTAKRMVRSRQAKKPYEYDIIFDIENNRFIGMEILSASQLLKKKSKQ